MDTILPCIVAMPQIKHKKKKPGCSTKKDRERQQTAEALSAARPAGPRREDCKQDMESGKEDEDEDGHGHENQSSKREKEPKAETDRKAMMRYLVKNHPRPQCDGKDWDIRVECGLLTWFVHRQVLQACPFFADLLPPPGPPNGIDNVLRLHGHMPEQLAHVLYFMYFNDYPGADYDAKDPLVGDSVLTNTAMYLAGASVGYQDMMLFAVQKIEAWSTAVLAGLGIDSLGPLQRAVQRQRDGTMDYALLRLADPLRRSLRIVYEQPPEVRHGLLLPLRLALVRFAGVALPYLATNESFRAHFRNEWLQPLSETETTETLAENVLMDHALFQELGMLRRPHSPSSSDKRRPTATATNAKANANATPADLPSISYLFDLLQRLANVEQWGRHVGVTTSKAANGGDGRRDRGSRGDGRDWRLRMGDVQCEHDTIMRELEHALRCVFER